MVLLRPWPCELIVHETVWRKAFPALPEASPTSCSIYLPPVTTKLQVKEAGNPQYPLSSSLRSLVGNQETIPVGVRRTIIYKKDYFCMYICMKWLYGGKWGTLKVTWEMGEQYRNVSWFTEVKKSWIWSQGKVNVLKTQPGIRFHWRKVTQKC